MNCSQLAAIFASIFGFASFHYLFNDGWGFDGTWSKWRELKERIFPGSQNRNPGWWKGTVAYLCAVISMLLWIFAAIKSN